MNDRNTESHTGTLQRVLGFNAGIAVSVGVAVGAGIFRAPQGIAGLLPAAPWIFAVWVVGGLLAFLDALVLAELSTFVPKAGGWYAYVRKAYGDFPAFLYGWVTSLITYPASVAAVANVLAEYAGSIVKPVAQAVGVTVAYGPFQQKVVAIAAILIFAGLNYPGIRQASWTQQIFTAAKVLAVLLIVGMAFGTTTVEIAPATPVATATKAITLAAFGVALQAVMWTYDGYADVITLAEELKNPSRDLPRVLFGSIVLLTGLYLLLNASFLYVLTPSEIGTMGNVAATVVSRRIGVAGEAVISFLICLIAIGGINAQLISGPRITYAMARDGLSFTWLTWVNRGGTPAGALLLHAGCAVALTLYGTFDFLVAMTIFIIWMVNTSNVVTVFLFRRRYPIADRPFLMPGYPVVPLLALGISAFLLANMVRESTDPVIKGLAVILVGVPVYLFWRRTHRKNQ